MSSFGRRAPTHRRGSCAGSRGYATRPTRTGRPDRAARRGERLEAGLVVERGVRNGRRRGATARSARSRSPSLRTQARTDGRDRAGAPAERVFDLPGDVEQREGRQGGRGQGGDLYGRGRTARRRRRRTLREGRAAYPPRGTFRSVEDRRAGGFGAAVGARRGGGEGGRECGGGGRGGDRTRGGRRRRPRGRVRVRQRRAVAGRGDRTEEERIGGRGARGRRGRAPRRRRASPRRGRDRREGRGRARRRRAPLEVVEHVHEGDEGVVGSRVRAEVLVDVAVGEPLRAHVVEVVGRGEPPPGLRAGRRARRAARTAGRERVEGVEAPRAAWGCRARRSGRARRRPTRRGGGCRARPSGSSPRPRPPPGVRNAKRGCASTAAGQVRP